MQNEQQQHPAAPVAIGGTEAAAEPPHRFLARFWRLAPCDRQRLFPYVFRRRRCYKPVQDRVTLTSDRNDNAAKPKPRDAVRLSEPCAVVPYRDIDCLRRRRVAPDRIELAAPVGLPTERVKTRPPAPPVPIELEEKFVAHATRTFRAHADPLTARLDLIQLAHEWGIFVYRAAMLTEQAARAVERERPQRALSSSARIKAWKNKPEKIEHRDHYRGRFFALLALIILIEIFILTYLMR